MRGALVIAALASLCACGASEFTPGDGGAPDSGTPDAGPATPITAAAGKWTWVDFPDSACDDGTPTGIGVNPGTSSNLIVFLNGGGACWNAQDCLVNNTSAHGPFGGVQFNQVFGGGSPTGTAITKLDTDRLEAAGTSGRTRVFYIPGASHTMLGSVGAFSQSGVSLTTFLSQQVSGAAWVSQKP